MRSHGPLLVMLAYLLAAGIAFAGGTTAPGDDGAPGKVQTYSPGPPAPPPAGIESQAQGFESTTFPPPGWDTVQNDGGVSNWYRTLTNPRSGIAAVRIDYEGPPFANDDWLTTPLVYPRNLPGEDSLVFWYRAQSASYADSFEVWISPEANGRTPAQFLSGGTRIYNNTTNNSTSYLRVALSLAPYFGQAIHLAWRYDAWDRYRCYLDDIVMPDPPPTTVNDIAALALVTPPSGGFIAQGTAFAPVASFRNVGSANQGSSFSVRYDILDAGSSVVYTNTQSVPSLASGVATQVTFSSSGTILASGAYTIRAVALLSADDSRANDTLTGAITIEPVVTVPYAQNFEGVTDEGWTTMATGGANQWVRGTPAKPAQIDGPHGGTKCWVTRLDSFYVENHNAALVSPIFNFTSLPASFGLVFWHNFQTESGYDAAVLEYSTDGGVWLRVDSVLGVGPNFSTPTSSDWYNNASTFGSVAPPKWSNTSTAFAGHDSGYIRSVTKLAAFAGIPAIKFRWRFVSDTEVNYEGWAVDDVEVKNVELHDIGMNRLAEALTGSASPGAAGRAPRATAVTAPGLFVDPASATVEKAPVTLRAAVQNFGSFAENSYQIGWEIDGVPQAPVANGVPLPAGGKDTITLTWALPTAGLHFVRAWTILASDSVLTNDSSATVGVFITPPYTLLEERFNGSFPPAGWTTINRDGGGSTGPWDPGDPLRFTALEGPDGGFAADEYTTANGLYIDDYLITPNTGTPLDPSGVDSLIFYVRSYDSPYADSLEIRLSTTGTDTADFTTLLDYIDVPKTGWTRYAYQLPLSASRYVAFRYLIYDGGSSGTNSVYIGLDVVHIVRYGGTNATVDVALGPGWNLVSNPVDTPADSMRQLFPQSLFDYGFGFSSVGGYVQSAQLAGGAGYWGKMAAAHTQTISGGVRNSSSVAVSQGWNMIGALSTTIDTSSSHVTTVPAGIRSSNFFRYNPSPSPGYAVTPDLAPGYGYWVKMSAAGTLTLNLTVPPSAPARTDRGRGIGDLHAVTITDALGNTQTLHMGEDPRGEIPSSMFELPPAPPEGVFDARFDDGTMVRTVNAGARADLPIVVRATAYPLTVTWKMLPDGRTYELSDAAGLLVPEIMTGEGSLVIARPVPGLRISATEGETVPAEFALAQNYPNPFNPSTTVSFDLPVQAVVTVDVFDLLGQRVTTLLDEQRPAGRYRVVWNGTSESGRQLGSGTYFLRFAAKGAGSTFTATRKMMFVK